MPPRRFVPLFIDADHIGYVEDVLRHLGIEAFSTSDGHSEDLYGPYGPYRPYHHVPRRPEPELQDDASFHGSDGCSINQFIYDEPSLAVQSSELEELTKTLSSLSMSTNSHHVDLYPAKSAPALCHQPPPSLSSPQKKKYYVITVGKCAGIFYDEWDNVKRLTDGVSGARFKGFATQHAAEEHYSAAKRSCKVRIVRNPGDNDIYGPLDSAIQ